MNDSILQATRRTQISLLAIAVIAFTFFAPENREFEAHARNGMGVFELRDIWKFEVDCSLMIAPDVYLVSESSPTFSLLIVGSFAGLLSWRARFRQ